jgi:hypothetical protein
MRFSSQVKFDCLSMAISAMDLLVLNQRKSRQVRKRREERRRILPGAGKQEGINSGLRMNSSRQNGSVSGINWPVSKRRSSPDLPPDATLANLESESSVR